MLSKDILPKLEREDVETRLNQIEHVVTTRLNAINLQRLKKVWLCQDSIPSTYKDLKWYGLVKVQSTYRDSKRYDHVKTQCDSKRYGHVKTQCDSKRYGHVKTQCHHPTETQKGIAMSRLNTINMTQNSMAMSRFNQSTEINKRYGHVMVHHHLSRKWKQMDNAKFNHNIQGTLNTLDNYKVQHLQYRDTQKSMVTVRVNAINHTLFQGKLITK